MTVTPTNKTSDFLMIKLFALALFAATSAHATTVGLHLGSVHDKPGFNDSNPGIYIKTEEGYTVGTVYNSVNKQAFYAGYTFSRNFGKVELAATVGGITGYTLPVTPMLVPSVVVSLTDSFSARINFLAKVHKYGASALHFTVERKF
jgi:hypothetical protein